MSKSRVFPFVFAAVLLGWLPSSQADPLTVIVTTPITTFSGTGTGDVPLALDPPDQYAYVPSTATISASSAGESMGVTTIVFDDLLGNVHVSSSFQLYFDLSLADTDPSTPPNYVAGLPATLVPKAPLTIGVEADVDAFALLAAIAPLLGSGATDAEIYEAILAAGAATAISTISPARYALGVDVNANGINDVMTLTTTDLDPTTLSFGSTADDLLDTVTDWILGGQVLNPLEINAGVDVSGLSLTFTGDVFDDAADPPFTLVFNDVVLASPQALAVPEPSSLLLLVAAGLGLIAVTRRRKSA